MFCAVTGVSTGTQPPHLLDSAGRQQLCLPLFVTLHVTYLNRAESSAEFLLHYHCQRTLVGRVSLGYTDLQLLAWPVVLGGTPALDSQYSLRLHPILTSSV